MSSACNSRVSQHVHTFSWDKSGDCTGVFLYDHHLEEEAGVFYEAIPVGGKCAGKPACKCLALHQDHLMSWLPLPIACSGHLFLGSVHCKEGLPPYSSNV